MAMQIVTGYTGTAHIKSAHDRSRNAGVIGRGSYVLSTGNMLAAKMQTANTLRIVDGDLMLQGTHATIEAGTHEDLAIDNGTQGMKRNDLVVARYERLSGEPKTESVTLRVIKGSPSSGAAADPDHVEGDVLKGDLVAEMPLYRVPIDGITPGKPVPLFDVAPTIDALRDSLSQRPWVTCGKTGGSGPLGQYEVNLTPPPWAPDRKPDAVLCEPMVLGSEEHAKLFYATVWSIDSSRYMQLRLWRRDKNSFAGNQGITCSWVAIWNP